MDNEIGGAVTVEEFCERYRIGRTKFYEMLRAGDLKARKIGARTVILASDIRQWERGLDLVR